MCRQLLSFDILLFPVRYSAVRMVHEKPLARFRIRGKGLNDVTSVLVGSVQILLHLLDNVALGVTQADFQRHLAGQAMRGTAEAWVIGSERHLDHV